MKRISYILALFVVLATFTLTAQTAVSGTVFDESLVTSKEDYNLFISRTQQIVASKGKRTIGWDEIHATNLLSNTLTQYWHSTKNAKAAVNQGVKILMSPAVYAYLVMKYDSLSPLGLNWASYINVKKAYSWDPGSLINSLSEEDIIGIEAPLWSETIEDFDDIAYLAFPRILGYAEIGLSDQENRNWENYKYRLAQHGSLLNDRKVNFFQSELIPWPTLDKQKM